MKKREPDVIFEAPPIASLERWQIVGGTFFYTLACIIVFGLVMDWGGGLILFGGGVAAVYYLWWRIHNRNSLDKELLQLLEKSHD